MRAFALVCLGMSILIPGARAETRGKAVSPASVSNIQTGSTNLTVSPAAVSAYAVLANSGDHAQRSFAVQLERRVSDVDLKRIADEIRSTDTENSAATVVMFYLPGMKIGHGVWAHAYYPASPETAGHKAEAEPKVTIVGLTITEELRLTMEARRDSRNLIGAWLTATPAPVGKLTLYREKGRLFAEWGLRDGARFAEEVTETALPDSTGWRYDRRDARSGNHMRMTPDGDLELRDRDDVATSTQAIKRLPGDFNVAVAKSNESKIAEAKGQASTNKNPVSTVKRSVVVTTVGSATTTDGAMGGRQLNASQLNASPLNASGEKQPKAKIAQPMDQPAKSSANVMFR